MSKKNEIQQTLDARLFKVYEVSERKVGFGGSVTVDASVTAQLQPHQTYLATVKLSVDSATIKFGDATAGTIKLNVTALEEIEALEQKSVLEGNASDDPRPGPEPEIESENQEDEATESIADPETSVFKEQPTVDEVVADQEAEDAAALEGEADDEDLPEPEYLEEPDEPNNVVDFRKPDPESEQSEPTGPNCFGTWEAIPDCDGCALEAECKAQTQVVPS